MNPTCFGSNPNVQEQAENNCNDCPISDECLNPLLELFVRNEGGTPDGQPYYTVQAGGDGKYEGWVGDTYICVTGIVPREYAHMMAAGPQMYRDLKIACHTMAYNGVCKGKQCADCEIFKARSKAGGHVR